MSEWSVTVHGSRTYMDVVAALVAMARGTSQDFEFGPLDLATLQSSGLTLVLETDTTATALAKMPGVAVERTD